MKKKLLFLLCIIICFNKIQSQTNWELLNPKPTPNTGKDIDFISSSIGYLITPNDLLETTDSGASWQKKLNISGGNDMSFYSTHGYIVGDYGYVLKSTDNGTSWTQIDTGFYESFNTVNIIDENNIILSTAISIVKSIDGGITWKNLSVPSTMVIKTFFVNSLVGHAVTNDGKILKTIDGGQNWYVTQSTNTSPSGYFTVYFVNENIGFATREHDDMFKTTDGGETWVQLSGINTAMFDLHFINENIGFATGEFGATFKTADGGITWTPIFIKDGYYGDTEMYGIYFLDENIGYATGVHGRIVKTIDGGKTWIQNSITYDNISQITFLTSNIGYCLVGNSFLKTTDAGKTWNNIGSPLQNEYTGRFDFINEKIGFALVGGTLGTSGNTGSVFKTTDGGISWAKMNNDYQIITENLYSIDFINENIGYVSGGFNQRKVLKTTDGGHNWTQVADQVFGKIQFINEQVGYANRIGNYYGAIYKTIDGGNTWNISIELEGEDIQDFDFVDENNGYFVGDQKLIYKTNDGGINWVKLEIPYEWYTLVKFYSKNVGYIADEEGLLYRTMNGGESWDLLANQPLIKSIELVNNTIFTAGVAGKIYKSNIEYDSVVLHINPAVNISNASATLAGNVTSNEGEISNIQFEYSTDYFFNNSIATIPIAITPNESLNLTNDITNLNPNTTYYCRLKGNYNAMNYTSEIINFTTLPDYQITTNYTYNFSSTKAQLSSTIVSNGYDITNVEFQYGTKADELTSSVNGTPTLVKGNTAENIKASIENLQPETQYFYRAKATHKGVEIYGNVLSLTTSPKYQINLYNPTFNGNDVTLTAYFTDFDQGVSDIVFEYGTINYENNIKTSPSEIIANNSAYLMETITNLDPNSVYYYRLKATQNGATIYSEERVFSLSGNIIMVSATITEPENNTLELKGLINSYGVYLTNIHFEYGLTEALGSSIMATPNYYFGYNSSLIKASINNALPDQTYYYRITANDQNGNIIYSDTYQYTLRKLGTNDFSIEKQVFIYPNPTNDFINIKFKNHETINAIVLYDMTGKIIKLTNQPDSSDVIKIDFSNFQKGIYFLKVNFTNNETVSKKIMLK